MKHVFYVLSLIGVLVTGGVTAMQPVPLNGKKSETQVVSIDINPGQTLHRVNRLLLGTNIQWVDNGDNFVEPGTNRFNQPLIEKVKALNPALLRFPGGSLSDAYHWKDAVGPLASRKEGLHIFSGQKQKSLFGTDEFLALCRILKTEAIITVNPISGTKEEAAEWVSYCNTKNNPKVTYWQIGNEPYLEPVNSKVPVDQKFPEQFAQTYLEFYRAMKAQDPSIKIGLPLRSDIHGRYPGTPYPGWIKRVYPAVAGYVDFVSLHNAYFPVLLKNGEYKFPDSFLALMAASQEVSEDITRTKALLKTLSGGKLPGIAITEYNALFGFPNISEAKFTASLGSGIYTASLLTHFLKDTDLILANFWGQSGNWYLGAISPTMKLRPQYYALKIVSDYLGERVVPYSAKNIPVFESPACGFMPAKKNVPVLDVLTTFSSNTGYIILVNKSLTLDISVTISVGNFLVNGPTTGVVLTGTAVTDDNEFIETVRPRAFLTQTVENRLTCVVPKYSIAAISFQGKLLTNE